MGQQKAEDKQAFDSRQRDIENRSRVFTESKNQKKVFKHETDMNQTNIEQQNSEDKQSLDQQLKTDTTHTTDFHQQEHESYDNGTKVVDVDEEKHAYSEDTQNGSEHNDDNTDDAAPMDSGHNDAEEGEHVAQSDLGHIVIGHNAIEEDEHDVQNGFKHLVIDNEHNDTEEDEDAAQNEVEQLRLERVGEEKIWSLEERARALGAWGDEGEEEEEGWEGMREREGKQSQDVGRGREAVVACYSLIR